MTAGDGQHEPPSPPCKNQRVQIMDEKLLRQRRHLEMFFHPRHLVSIIISSDDATCIASPQHPKIVSVKCRGAVNGNVLSLILTVLRKEKCHFVLSNTGIL